MSENSLQEAFQALLFSPRVDCVANYFSMCVCVCVCVCGVVVGMHHLIPFIISFFISSNESKSLVTYQSLIEQGVVGLCVKERGGGREGDEGR